jgi:hypothetical protein
MELQTLAPSTATAMPMPMGGGTREAFCASSVVVRHLKTPGEIASVLHLREEIDLSVHAAAGSQFESLEKKETSAATSSVLT